MAAISQNCSRVSQRISKYVLRFDKISKSGSQNTANQYFSSNFQKQCLSWYLFVYFVHSCYIFSTLLMRILTFWCQFILFIFTQRQLFLKEYLNQE